jgi:SAM-dependent methyltransferase
MTGTDRYAQQREREAAFHDRWASEMAPEKTLVDETFSSVTAVENHYILEQYGEIRGKRILDYGCGSAEGGIYLAKQGAQVVGIDVSQGMLDAAQRLARYHGVEIETRRVTGSEIPADTDEFDFVYGNGVLHHVDLGHARRELARILKNTGKGCFIEPLKYNPVIELYRHIANTVRTEDEHPLSFSDIEDFRQNFHEVKHREFWLTTLSVFFKFYLLDRVDPKKERYWKKIYTDAPKLESFFRPLKRLDDQLLARIPPLRRLCWTTVITVAKPRK